MSEAATGSPKVDPESLALRAQPRAVRRLSRRMLAAAAGVLALAVLGATVWSLQSQRRERKPVAELYNVERVARAEDLERLPKDYEGLVPAVPPKASVPMLGERLPGDLGPAILKSQQPVAGPGGGVDPAQGEQMAADEAARSSVFFRGTSGKASGAGASASQPARRDAGEAVQAATQQAFNALSRTPTVMGPGSPMGDLGASQNGQERKEAFLARPGDSATRNPGQLQLPASPYQVMAGTIIPAALLTGINSDLPGQVAANVTEAVYDTATGRHLLIPQGSRLMGRYDSKVDFGQRRVLLVWTRLILPDTSSIALDRLPGIDPAGYAGLEDGVDWHWDRILAGAALSTLLGAGAELAAPSNRTTQAGGDGNRVVISLREGVQDSVNQAGQEITKRSMNVQPTLTVRPGFALRVMVNKDLMLRPFRPLFFAKGVTP